MNDTLSASEIAGLREQLEHRYRSLLALVREELNKSDQERYADLVGRVHDTGDESVADLLSDINLADIDRHIHEIRDVEAALQRIKVGGFGECSDCGEPIGWRRMEAQPEAQRCLSCQARFEAIAQRGAGHSL